MNKIRLYCEQEFLNDRGIKVQDSLTKTLDPVLKKHLDKGVSMIDLERLIIRHIQYMLSLDHASRWSKYAEKTVKVKPKAKVRKGKKNL